LIRKKFPQKNNRIQKYYLINIEVECPLCRVDMDLNHMVQGGSSMLTVGFPFKDGPAQ